jgi:hypothetical protein
MATKTQYSKGEDIMRSTLRTALVGAAALLLTAVGTARASTTEVAQAKVPFPFVVNGRTLPAGTYRVERDDLQSSIVLLIRDAKHQHVGTFISTVPDYGCDPAGWRPALSFTRQGNQYRLSGIWESQGEGWEVVSR